MLETIPLKRNAYKAHPHAKTQVAGQKRSGHLNNKNRGPRKIKWWMVALLVLAVAIAGIAVIRLSRAATVDSVGIPQNMSDIQNYIDSLSVKNTEHLELPSSKYVELHYPPTVTTDQVAVVAYYVDGKKFYATTQSPYTFTFDTERVSNGEHNLTAIAFDANGLPVAALERTIMVNNTVDVLGNIKNIITYPLNRFFNL